MQRRTSFCRSLIHDPPLILMDEPLGALDAMIREQLNADLERLWIRRTKTVIEPLCPRTLEVCETLQFHAHVAEIPAYLPRLRSELSYPRSARPA